MIRKNSKINQLYRLLSNFNQVGIAFSGGADSSFLLRAALDVLGTDKMVVLHARSCLQKKADQERAASWPERHGYAAAAVRIRSIAFDPLAWPEFAANGKNRCYLCKKRVYSIFLQELARDGISVLLDGSNSDDLRQGETGRPGLRAIAELGVRTPLADSGLRKAEIRALSRDLQLDTWNQPAASCLATRIPVDMRITAGRLARIEALEQAVLAQGFADCRVRLDSSTTGNITLQLPESGINRLGDPAVRQRVCRLLRSMGTDKMFLDLDGR